MAGLPKFSHPNLLVGTDTFDDAGVYKINDEQAIIQTLDFFTPMVDDPYLFGQIAAANALSDVYAMGGTPITAMNIAAFPTCMDMETLNQILLGGADKVIEAGALLIGGHTVQDDEPKFGLSVTGLAHPDCLTPNGGGEAGDVLFLTKKVGTGLVSTGIKAGLVKMEDAMAMAKEMAVLNKYAAEAMQAVGVKGATDVTGFGLLGHLKEIAEASGTGAVVYAEAVPVWEQAREMADMGLIPGGCHRNRRYIEHMVTAADYIPQDLMDCLYDPLTSGGLLMAVHKEKEALMKSELESRGVNYAVIGRLTGGSGILVE
jgi:selenide,water dikinase